MCNIDITNLITIVNELINNNQFSRAMKITWDRIIIAKENNDIESFNHEINIFVQLLQRSSADNK